MRHLPIILLGLLGILRADADSGLVNVVSMTRPPLEEIRYATSYNFTGAKLYPFPAAYVRRELIPQL